MEKIAKQSIDKKIEKLRLDILSLETELFKMLYPKDDKEESFLPPGNEIAFDFGKTRYENMMYNIEWSLNDLNNIKEYSKRIKVKKKGLD